MQMELSKHAGTRQRQRGISDIAVDVVLRFGRTDFHKGAEIYSLDRRAKRKAKKYLQAAYSPLEKELSQVYVVVCEGVVITVARKNRRSKRDRG